MKQIKFNDLLDIPEGLILLGCGGDLNEWINGVLDILFEKEIIESKDDFGEPVCLTTSGGRIDLVFPFAENNKINIGKLAMWRLQFGDASWASDYIVNYEDQHE